MKTPLTYIMPHKLSNSLRMLSQNFPALCDLLEPLLLFFLVQSMQLHQIIPQFLNILNSGKADVVSLFNEHRLLDPVAVQCFQHRLIIKRIMQQLIDDLLVSRIDFLNGASSCLGILQLNVKFLRITLLFELFDVIISDHFLLQSDVQLQRFRSSDYNFWWSDSS